MLNSILYLIFYMNGFMLHDFHVSICEIEYDQERKALEITHKLFLDDLEQGLNLKAKNGNIDVTNPKDKIVFQQTMNKYLLENFSVIVNGKQVVLNYLGSEIEEDVMYCYVDIIGVKKLKSISVKNTLLMQVFDDQVNIVHVEVEGKTRSMKLSNGDVESIISY